MRFVIRNQVYLVATVMIGLFAIGGYVLFKRFTDMPMMMWQTDFNQRTVALSEITMLAEPNAILPINQPKWASVSEVTWLSDKSPVIVLNGITPVRAYPLAVLMNHAVVNDMVNNQAIMVTFCELCNSPIIYSREVNGEILQFAATGTLRNGGLMLWDDKSQSWWQQLTGEAIVGDYSGMMLKTIPSVVVGFKTFKDRYPQGVILIGDETLSSMSYGRNPYIGYDTNPQPLFYSGVLDERLFATERVLAGVVDGQPIAYPYSLLNQVYVINDEVGAASVVVFWQSGLNSTQDHAKIEESRDVGMAVLFSRWVNGTVLTFRYEDGKFLDNETNSVWNIFGEAVEGEMTGAMLMQYNACPYFWFSWVANYPQTHVYEP